MVDADVEVRVFEDFFRDEYPRLVPMLHVLTGDRHRAEDLAQEALFRAQRDWRRISAYDRPGAWVRRVALHAASNAGRRRGREQRALGDDSASEVTYVVWYDASGPSIAVDRAFLITRCSRGVAVDESGAPIEPCV